MPNKNYIRGRAFEHKRRKAWERDGYVCARTAGSKSPFDIIAIKPGGCVCLVQCKSTKSPGVARKLMAEFKTNPPLPVGGYTQCMEIWDSKTREFHVWCT